MVYLALHDVVELKVRVHRKVINENASSYGPYYVLIINAENKNGENTEITFFSEHAMDWKTGEEIEICSLEGLQEYPELEDLSK